MIFWQKWEKIMNSLEIEQAVVNNMHSLSLEKQQSILEFTFFIQNLMNHSKNELIEHNLNARMTLKSFEKGDLSLGQLAKSFDKSKVDTVKMLGQLKIPIAEMGKNNE